MSRRRGEQDFNLIPDLRQALYVAGMGSAVAMVGAIAAGFGWSVWQECWLGERSLVIVHCRRVRWVPGAMSLCWTWVSLCGSLSWPSE